MMRMLHHPTLIHKMSVDPIQIQHVNTKTPAVSIVDVITFQVAWMTYLRIYVAKSNELVPFMDLNTCLLIYANIMIENMM